MGLAPHLNICYETPQKSDTVFQPDWRIFIQITSIVRQFDSPTYFSFPNKCRITEVALYFQNQVLMKICSKEQLAVPAP